MNTIFSMIKKSYELSNLEKRFLKIYFDYMRNHITNGDGSYLATFDFDKISFKYSPNLVINETDVLGYWSPLFSDSIFIMPNLSSKKFRDVAKTMLKEDDPQYEVLSTKINEQKGSELVYKKIEDFKNIAYLAGGYRETGSNDDSFLPVVAILHELYHKWQFTSAKIPYIFNLFVSLFFGYELASKLSFLVEGDVRKHVDNENTRKVSLEFSKFFSYIIMMAYPFICIESLKKKINHGNLTIKDQLENLETINQRKINLDDEIKKLKSIDKTVFNICLKFVKDEDLLTKEFLKLIE